MVNQQAWLNANDVAKVLEIDLVSAIELCNGTIEFEIEELVILANYYRISVDELLNDVIEG